MCTDSNTNMTDFKRNPCITEHTENEEKCSYSFKYLGVSLIVQLYTDKILLELNALYLDLFVFPSIGAT